MDKVTLIRSISFFGVFAICMSLQWVIPSRKFEKDRWQFMTSNLLLVLFNTVLIGLLPIIPFYMAMVASENSFGLLNMISLWPVVEIALGIIFLDIVIYFQHRVFHQVNFLWRLHSMHHIDPMLDTTSGLRFHPIEIVISNFVKVGAIILFGVNPLSVIIFEVLLNGLSMFNHSNLAITKSVEKVLSKVLITPALHTIHHSKRFDETNSNYGFSVPWWDMIFGTFKSKGTYLQSEIRIGTAHMPEKKYQLFPGMLVQPFMKKDQTKSG
jgi:sterol desaturase/sphingolipid hydroxylase (fatty acid hydroxylase superfamily)